MKPTLPLVVVATLTFVSAAHGQQSLTEHTLKLGPDAKVGAAKIKAMSFLVGTWQGQALGGVVDESWLPPVDGSMLGMFRLSRDGKLEFYELMTFTEVAGSLELRVKHFSPELAGWEAKNDKVTFRLIKAEGGKVYFEGLTFAPEGEELTIYLAMGTPDKGYREEVFKMRRVK